MKAQALILGLTRTIASDSASALAQQRSAATAPGPGLPVGYRSPGAPAAGPHHHRILGKGVLVGRFHR